VNKNLDANDCRYIAREKKIEEVKTLILSIDDYNLVCCHLTPLLIQELIQKHWNNL
jgi:hypothetical protein